MTSSAVAVTTVKETTPSLMQLSVTLKDLGDHLALRNELTSKTLDNVSESLKKSGQAIQDLASDIQKQLEALDQQLQIERMFARYLT
jgi:hypothetical protein